MLSTPSRLFALGAGLGLLAAMLLTGVSRVNSNPQAGQPTDLSEQTMSRLFGAGACKDCRYAGARLDECYHESWTDPCDPDGCIANYAIDSTCDPGTGTCNAIKDSTAVGVVQYWRADSGCTTNNSAGWTTWLTRYYGAACTPYNIQVRCQKSNGSCDGTMIESTGRNPGIECY